MVSAPPSLRAPPYVTGLALMATAGLLYAMVVAHEVVLLGFLAMLVSVLMSFPVNLLSRRIPRGLAVVLVLLSGCGAAVVAIFALGPHLADQVQQLWQRLPEALESVQRWLSRTSASEVVKTVPQGAENLEQRAAQMLGEVAARSVPAAISVVTWLTAAVLVVALAAFLTYQPDSYRLGLRALVPATWEDGFDELWARLAVNLRHWVGGILLAMTVMGTLTAVGLAIAGINDWLLLGLLTFLATFVPYVGAIASAIPGLVVGLSQSPAYFLRALVVYLVVHICEGYIVEPLLMRRAVQVRPAAQLGAQALLGMVFGPLGIVVATPLLVCLKTIVGFLYTERVLHKRLPEV